MPVKKIKTNSAAEKKPAARKAQSGRKTDELKDALVKELRALIPRLDSEGLQSLIEQVQVHLYNMQVDELNRTMEKSTAVKAVTAEKKAKTGKSADALRIEGSPSGSSFYLYNNGQSVMFARDEMIHMVNIACASVTKIEIQENLFNWFRKERRDIFSLIPIADKFDARLGKIAALLKKNFRVQKN